MLFRSVFPFLAVAAAAFFALRAVRPAIPGLFVAVSAAFALLVATLAAPPAPPYGVRLWRAGVYGAFSGLDPRREELRRMALSASSPAEQRAARGMWRAFGPR